MPFLNPVGFGTVRKDLRPIAPYSADAALPKPDPPKKLVPKQQK